MLGVLQLHLCKCRIEICSAPWLPPFGDCTWEIFDSFSILIFAWLILNYPFKRCQFVYYMHVQDPETKKPRVKLYFDKETGRKKGDALITYLKVMSIVSDFPQTPRKRDRHLEVVVVMLSIVSFTAINFCFWHVTPHHLICALFPFCKQTLGAISSLSNPDIGRDTFSAWRQNPNDSNRRKIWAERYIWKLKCGFSDL